MPADGIWPPLCPDDPLDDGIGDELPDDSPEDPPDDPPTGGNGDELPDEPLLPADPLLPDELGDWMLPLLQPIMVSINTTTTILGAQ